MGSAVLINFWHSRFSKQWASRMILKVWPSSENSVFLRMHTFHLSDDDCAERQLLHILPAMCNICRMNSVFFTAIVWKQYGTKRSSPSLRRQTVEMFANVDAPHARLDRDKPRRAEVTTVDYAFVFLQNYLDCAVDSLAQRCRDRLTNFLVVSSLTMTQCRPTMTSRLPLSLAVCTKAVMKLRVVAATMTAGEWLKMPEVKLPVLEALMMKEVITHHWVQPRVRIAQLPRWILNTKQAALLNGKRLKTAWSWMVIVTLTLMPNISQTLPSSICYCI